MPCAFTSPCSGRPYRLDARTSLDTANLTRAQRYVCTSAPICTRDHWVHPEGVAARAVKAGAGKGAGSSRRRPPCVVCGAGMDGEHGLRVRHEHCEAEGRRRYQRTYDAAHPGRLSGRAYYRSTAKERGKATGGGTKVAHALATAGLGR